MSEPLKTVWITTAYHFTEVPSVEQYQAERVGPTGAKVILYGRPKFIPKATGRRFFTDEEQLKAYLRKYIEERIASHERQAAKLRVAQDEGITWRAVPYEPRDPNTPILT